MARLIFGGGLRLMELLRLRVKDLDLTQEILTIRGGKGIEDLVIALLLDHADQIGKGGLELFATKLFHF